MGRRRKYKNLKVFSASVDAETLDKIDRQRGKLSRGEYIEILVNERGDVAQIVAENRALKRGNEELRERISKLERYVEELESKLRTASDKKEQGEELAEEDREEAIRRTLEELKATFELKRKKAGSREEIVLDQRIAELKARLTKLTGAKEGSREWIAIIRALNTQGIDEAVKIALETS